MRAPGTQGLLASQHLHMDTMPCGQVPLAGPRGQPTPAQTSPPEQALCGRNQAQGSLGSPKINLQTLKQDKQPSNSQSGCRQKVLQCKEVHSALRTHMATMQCPGHSLLSRVDATPHPICSSPVARSEQTGETFPGPTPAFHPGWKDISPGGALGPYGQLQGTVFCLLVSMGLHPGHCEDYRH